MYKILDPPKNGVTGKTDIEESDTFLDVDALRTQREAAMIEEALRDSKTYRIQDDKRYPFVFDKMIETARQNPIFVQGRSLVLPPGAIRKVSPGARFLACPYIRRPL